MFTFRYSVRRGGLSKGTSRENVRIPSAHEGLCVSRDLTSVYQHELLHSVEYVTVDWRYTHA